MYSFRRMLKTVLVACIACIVLSGCGHEHTWVEATCTEPRTCSECGETEGEALGHTWVEATCAEPRTCSKCGETEGEALGHTWVEANYQDPQMCSVCGATEGKPLTPAFEEHGLIINTEAKGTYDFVTACYDDRSVKTVGHATFSGYRIMEEDAGLGLEKKEGYEWRTVHISIRFNDDNALLYGFWVMSGWEDYYDIEGWENSYCLSTDKGTDTVRSVINFHGTEYECTAIKRSKTTGWVNNKNTLEIDYYVHVPIGYDGFVATLYDDSRNPWEEGMHIYDVADENTLFFRMK